MKRHFLYSPVIHVGNEEGVFRGACHTVDPTELADVVAGFAEHTENLAIEGQLVDTTGLGIGSV
jgi:hypothetical protein